MKHLSILIYLKTSIITFGLYLFCSNHSAAQIFLRDSPMGKTILFVEGQHAYLLNKANTFELLKTVPLGLNLIYDATLNEKGTHFAILCQNRIDVYNIQDGVQTHRLKLDDKIALDDDIASFIINFEITKDNTVRLVLKNDTGFYQGVWDLSKSVPSERISDYEKEFSKRTDLEMEFNYFFSSVYDTLNSFRDLEYQIRDYNRMISIHVYQSKTSNRYWFAKFGWDNKNKIRVLSKVLVPSEFKVLQTLEGGNIEHSNLNNQPIVRGDNLYIQGKVNDAEPHLGKFEIETLQMKTSTNISGVEYFHVCEVAEMIICISPLKMVFVEKRQSDLKSEMTQVPQRNLRLISSVTNQEIGTVDIIIKD